MPNNFDHTGLTVSDVQVSTEFYELLGFERVRDEPLDVDTDWIKQITGYPDAHLRIQHLSRNGETLLELLQYLSPPGMQLARMGPGNVGSAHVAVGVSNLDEEYPRLVAAGVEFRSMPIHILRGALAGVKAVYAVDPDGYTVELIETP